MAVHHEAAAPAVVEMKINLGVVAIEKVTNVINRPLTNQSHQPTCGSRFPEGHLLAFLRKLLKSTI